MAKPAGNCHAVTRTGRDEAVRSNTRITLSINEHVDPLQQGSISSVVRAMVL